MDNGILLSTKDIDARRMSYGIRTLKLGEIQLWIRSTVDHTMADVPTAKTDNNEDENDENGQRFEDGKARRYVGRRFGVTGVVENLQIRLFTLQNVKWKTTGDRIFTVFEMVEISEASGPAY